MSKLKNLSNNFVDIFKKKPEAIFFCPGRVNLVGEHLDYNGGTVMPSAINLGTYLALSLNNEAVFRFHSNNLKEKLEISIYQFPKKTGNEWYYYPLGILQQFFELETMKEKKKIGLNLLFWGNIPLGSGLSSSASIEVLTAYAINSKFNLKLSLLRLVEISKKVENEYIGLQCGIMDQFSVAFGKKDSCLMLNCKTLDFKYLNLPLREYSLVILNTNKPRMLSESKFNERVMECREALEDLQQKFPINSLVELSLETFLQNQKLIKKEVSYQRALHVISESERVKLVEIAIYEGNLALLGKIMYESHLSLKNNYEVSGVELDTLVDYCRSQSFVLGAKMTGAGFGGCAIALVKNDQLSSFKKEILAYYFSIIGYYPTVYKTILINGVRKVKANAKHLLAFLN